MVISQTCSIVAMRLETVNVLCLIFFYLVVYNGTSVIEEKRASLTLRAQRNILNAFHASIDSLKDWDTVTAIQNFNKLANKTLLNEYINEKPLLHHLLNLINAFYKNIASKPEIHYNMTIKDDIMTIISMSLDNELSPDQNVPNEPSALSKAIRLREVDLSMKIANKSNKISSVVDNIIVSSQPSLNDLNNLMSLINELVSLFNQLSDVPCQTSRMAKLLLSTHHALKLETNIDDEIIIRKYLELSEYQGAVVAELPKAVVKHSPSFNSTIVAALKLGQLNTCPLDYSIIVLDETMASLQSIILNQMRQRIVDQSSKTVVSTMLASILIDQDFEYKRNVLHNLCLSGSGTMLQNIVDIITELLQTTDVDTEGIATREYMQSRIIQALQTKDKRNLQPNDYAEKFGYSSRIAQSMRALHHTVNFPYSKAFSHNNTSMLTSNISHKRLELNGGWNAESLIFPQDNEFVINPQTIITDTDRCDIEERFDSIPSPEEFYDQYISISKPVIFRNVYNATSPIMMTLSKSSFLENYGYEKMPLSSIPYAGYFGGITKNVKASEIANLSTINISTLRPESTIDPMYTFSVPLSAWKNKLENDIPIPPFLDGMKVYSRDDVLLPEKITIQFYLGPAGSGAPVHYHINAVNSLAYGEKKWFLYPPSEAFYSATPSVQFVLFDSAATRARTCTQRSGDIIFIPTLWSHATLNLKQSIGVAHEFPIASSCSE